MYSHSECLQRLDQQQQSEQADHCKHWLGVLHAQSIFVIPFVIKQVAPCVDCTERSVHNWANKQSWIDFLPDPFDFTIHIWDLGGNREGVFAQEAGPIEALHSCMLPHETIHSLFKHAADVFAHFLGDTDALEAFWQVAATADDEWYREHPVLTSGAPPEVCIPIGLHGDDAGVHGDEQVLVITWNAVTYALATMDSRLVFTMLKVATIHPCTMKRVYEVLKWSFDALAKG